jgi:hypothetical protein
VRRVVTLDAVSGAAGQITSILCLAVFVAVGVVVLRRRMRVSRLHGLPSASSRRHDRRGAGEHDAHPRAMDDDGDDDAGDDDGGDGGDA